MTRILWPLRIPARNKLWVEYNCGPLDKITIFIVGNDNSTKLQLFSILRRKFSDNTSKSRDLMSQDPDKSASEFPLNDKKIINGWAFFDWANSAYALVITVAIFPIYFNEVIDDRVRFLGMEMENSAVFSYSLSIAYIIIAIILPLLTGIADYGGRKMAFMRFFTRLGGLACISLFFFEDEWFFSQAPLFIGVVGFILATIGFAGGLVFYNSYLPEIVTERSL